MKLNRFYRILPFLALSILMRSESCHKDIDCPKDAHNGLTVLNASNIRIRYNIYWNYPDTAIGEYNPAFDGTKGIVPGAGHTRGAGMGSCWESALKGGKKEWVYIFDADTIEHLSWDLVRRTNRGLLERKLIDLDYLQQNNFVVTHH